MLSTNDLSEILGVSMRTIERWIQKRYLIGIKIRKKYFVSKKDFVFFLEKHPEHKNNYLYFLEEKHSR